MAKIHYYTQTVYAGYLSVGDVIHEDNTHYHITAVSQEFVSDAMAVIVTFTTAEGQDLRYKKYANVLATIKVKG